MSAIMAFVHDKQGAHFDLRTAELGTVRMDCLDAPTVCQAPNLKSGDLVEVQLQQVGLSGRDWLLAASRDGTSIADLSSQQRRYQRYKVLLGWMSLLTMALSAVLAWAGPYRFPDQEQGDRLTFWP